jgi:predicted aldo/keto reductase-like oxidoreductase
MSTTRREFLTTATLAAGALAVGGVNTIAWGQVTSPADRPLSDIPELKTPETTRKGDMLFRKLGKTGEEVSILCLGGAHVYTPATATALIRRAVDSGLTFMDNCWDYRNGLCEELMGNAFQDGYRKKVFLATKFDGRTREAATRQMNESLARLKTDVIDLMMIHEIIHPTDGERIFAKGGAYEAMLEFKQAGKIRYLGFTGHKSPELFISFMDTAKKQGVIFDAAMMPINALDAHFRSFVRGVVPRMINEGTAVLGMKPMAAGALPRLNLITPEQCFHYTMTMPVSAAVTGMENDSRLDQALNAVKSYKPLPAPDLAALLAKTRDAALAGTSERFKTTPALDGTVRNPAWMG